MAATAIFPAGDITTIVSDNLAKVIEVRLDGEKGRIYFSNGVLLDFSIKTLGLLAGYECAYAVRISSNKASQGHIRCVTPTTEEKVYPWKTLLKAAGLINFHGSWDPKVLAYFIKCAPTLDIVSFTHWSCSNPSTVLTALPKKLFELSMHVSYDQYQEVVGSIGERSDSMEASIGRLMLVFENDLIRDPIHMFSQAAPNVLIDNAEVILLFGGEDGGNCIKTVAKELDLVYDNRIRLSKNSLYLDETPTKQYQDYEVYCKTDDFVRWRIGSLIGTVEKVEPVFFKQQHVPLIEDTTTFKLPYGVEKDEMFFTQINEGLLARDVHPKRIKLWNYENVDIRRNNSTCCAPEAPLSLKDVDMTSDNGLHALKIPGWITTRMQKVIYHDHVTEFLTSNGFYMVLDDMKDEPTAFDVLVTTKRFIFHCISSLRRCFHVENMQHFLRNAIHIEFMGTWFTKPFSDIGKRFNLGLRRLSMVRIEMHGKPLRYFFNDIPVVIKNNLSAFHFDGRATRDGSIASIVNGLRACSNPVMKFDELLIIANNLEWCTDSYKCRLDVHYNDMGHLLSFAGCATTVIVGPIDPGQLATVGHFDLRRNPDAMNSSASPILVPIAYPHTLPIEVPFLTKLCRGYRMQYQRRNMYFVSGYELLPMDLQNARRQ